MGKQSNRRYRNHRGGPHQKWNNNRKPSEGNHNSHPKPERRNQTPRITLREDQVGITEYVCPGEGFVGVLKSRFSDFHVNEIDLTGKVLQLNDLSIPEQEKDVLSDEALETARNSVKDVISDDLWLQIKQLAEAKPDPTLTPNDTAVHIEVTTLDKEKRTFVHKLIKKLYEGKVTSSTIDGGILGKGDDTKFIRVIKQTGNDRKTWGFPAEYVHFLVHKENLDTGEVAAAMANKMNLRPSQVNYSGTKDKRGKTTQKFCIKKRTPRQIVGSVKQIQGVKVGNFEFHKDVLKLGDLKGNRFRIALRHLMGDRQKIETSLQNIKENGFINYFGLQRFGNCSSVPTYDVGVALLKSDYKQACELILKPRENDLPFLRAIREKWWAERNSIKAAAMFRSDRFIEKKLLDGLAQYGEHDYIGALRKIPRNMLLLYPHSFQSLVFNHIASRRIKEHGLKLIPGDLVYRNKEELDEDMEISEIAQADNSDEDGNGQLECEKEAPVPAEAELESEKTADNAASATEANEESKFKRKVKALTEEDIKSGQYSVYDVVLPLPGYDIKYPDNEIATWYTEIMEKNDLTSEKLKHKVKTFSMAGTYRKMLLKPSDMSWEFCTYNRPEQTLILSDIELLKGVKLEDSSKNEKDTFEALLLDFCLPTSAYATMMLRELLKSDTSSTNQCNLEMDAMKAKTVTATLEESNNEAEEKSERVPKRPAVDVENKDNGSSEEVDECKKARLEAD